MPAANEIIDGRYKLVRELGAGGMGSVFEATHTKIKTKRVAIKFMLRELAADPETVARFEREAEAASAVNHPGIIGIHDIGQTPDGTPYLVMDFLDGRSLEEEIDHRFHSGQGGKLPLDYVCFVACRVLSALAAAHAADIIHRDLKPDNIYLVDTKTPLPDVKILDFGIAGFTHRSQEITSLTKTGTVMGTPYYMSPEQARGRKDLDHRADLFSMGTILYQCLTGRFPFNGENYNDLIVDICTTDPPDPTTYRPDLPRPVEATIIKALQKDPEKRHADAVELYHELLPFAAHEEEDAGILSAKYAAVEPGPQNSASPSVPQPSLRQSPGEFESSAQFEATAWASGEQPMAASAPKSQVLTSTPSAWENESLPRQRRGLLVPALLGGIVFLLLATVGGGAFFLNRAMNGVRDNVTPPVPSEPVEPNVVTAAPTQPTPPTPSPMPEPTLNRWVKIEPGPQQVTLGLPAALSSLELSGFRAERQIKSPAHPYQIQQHEVTWAELSPWLAKHPDRIFPAPSWLPEKNNSQHPATGVPWETAKAYCESLGGQLPTDEEWELAARGSELRPYPWGSQPIELDKTHVYRPDQPLSQVMSNEQDTTPGDETRTIFDLLGNAREWTADIYRLDTPATPEEEAWTRAEGRTYRSVRGLSPSDQPPTTLHPFGAASRDALCATGPCAATPEDREIYNKLLPYIGFRCVRSAETATRQP